MDECTQTQEACEIDVSPNNEPYVWGRLVSINENTPNHDCTKDKIEIGRRSSCHVKISHPAVSGMHCRLTRISNQVIFLTDLSTNGTWVNRRKIGKNNKLLVTDRSEIMLIRTLKEKLGFVLYLTNERPKLREGAEAVYHIQDCIGSGAFATVKKCIHRRTGQEFAMKIIDKKKFQMNYSSKRKNALMDEVNILKRLSHKNIIKIYDVYETSSQLFLVLELVFGGDLFDRIVSFGGKGYPEDRARFIFIQMLEALDYLHRKGVVHRDLKPENILLLEKESDIIKLSDFGLSRIIGEGSFMKTLCGTPQYLAPEILRDSSTKVGYDKRVDLWSLGVILYILLSGTPPFNDDQNILRQVKKGRYSFPQQVWKNVSKSGIDLVRRLLAVNPTHRISMANAFKHSWVVQDKENEFASPFSVPKSPVLRNLNSQKQSKKKKLPKPHTKTKETLKSKVKEKGKQKLNCSSSTETVAITTSANNTDVSSPNLPKKKINDHFKHNEGGDKNSKENTSELGNKVLRSLNDSKKDDSKSITRSQIKITQDADTGQSGSGIFSRYGRRRSKKASPKKKKKYTQ